MGKRWLSRHYMCITLQNPNLFSGSSECNSRMLGKLSLLLCQMLEKLSKMLNFPSIRLWYYEGPLNKMQHKFLCVNLISRSWRTWEMNQINTHIPCIQSPWEQWSRGGYRCCGRTLRWRSSLWGNEPIIFIFIFWVDPNITSIKALRLETHVPNFLCL